MGENSKDYQSDFFSLLTHMILLFIMLEVAIPIEK